MDARLQELTALIAAGQGDLRPDGSSLDDELSEAEIQAMLYDFCKVNGICSKCRSRAARDARTLCETCCKRNTVYNSRTREKKRRANGAHR